LSFQCRHWRTASSAHTYRLLVVKEPADSFCCLPLALRSGPAAAKRCVRQQQRNEIMQHLLSHVNSFCRWNIQGKPIARLDNINFKDYLKRALAEKMSDAVT
jgi:hypothetical protein